VSLGVPKRENTVVCADREQDRLARLANRLRREGFAVIQAESAAQCLGLTLKYRPTAVVLDADLLQVDEENMAEFVCRVSSSTVVLLTVDNPTGWHSPPFVLAVAERGDVDEIVSLLRHAVASHAAAPRCS
jgi:response regulator RpfG family c-di-GMP phosphodiesterase